MHRHDSAWHDEYASRRTSVIEREGAESDEPGAGNANWVIDRGIGAERPPRFARIGEAILALKFEANHLANTNAAAVVANPREWLLGARVTQQV